MVADGSYGIALPFTYSVHGMSQSVQPSPQATCLSVPFTMTGSPTLARS